MKKSKLFFVLAILVIASICIFIKVNNSILTGNAVATQSIEITENNFAQFFTFTDMVSDLPKDSAIVIKTPKKTFVVTKGLIKEGTIENPDASLSLDSKVFPFPSNKFCSVLSQAYKNGNLQINLQISKAKAGWKYRTLLKYRGCLGA